MFLRFALAVVSLHQVVLHSGPVLKAGPLWRNALFPRSCGLYWDRCRF